MDFMALLQNFGVAVACLVALSLVVWRSVVWLGTHIAAPVATRHIKFLDDLSTAMASQSQSLQTMAVQQGKNLEGMQSIMGRLQEIIERQDRMLFPDGRKDAPHHSPPEHKREREQEPTEQDPNQPRPRSGQKPPPQNPSGRGGT